MKRLLIMTLSLTMAIFSMAVLTVPQPAVALFESSRDSACGGVALDDNPQTCDSKAGDTINRLITQILNLISFVAGIAAVVMIIVAGVKFITSQGESANIASARNTILYAIIGLVVVGLSQFIVRFVLTKFK